MEPEPLTDEDIAEARRAQREVEILRNYERRTHAAYKQYIQRQNAAAEAYNAAVKPHVAEMMDKTRSARGKFVAEVRAAKKEYLEVVDFADRKLKERLGKSEEPTRIVDIKDAAVVYETEIDEGLTGEEL